MTPRRLSALPVLLLVAIALAGCVATPAPTPTPSETPAATPPQSPSAEPATEPAAEPAATCETVLTADAYAKLSTDGLLPIEPRIFDPLATQLAAAGGLGCSWGKPQTDIVLTVVQLTDADWGVWEPAFAGAGFVETNDPVAGAYTGPVEPGAGISPVVVVTDVTLTFVNAPAFAGWIAPTS